MVLKEVTWTVDVFGGTGKSVTGVVASVSAWVVVNERIAKNKTKKIILAN